MSDEVTPDEAVPGDNAVDEVVEGDDVVDAGLVDAGLGPVPTEPPPAAVPVQPVDTGYTPAGVPTFDSVREKIETRYGTAIGAAELSAETPQGRTVEEQYDARQRAAAERLAQIRASMHGDDADQK